MLRNNVAMEHYYRVFLNNTTSAGYGGKLPERGFTVFHFPEWPQGYKLDLALGGDSARTIARLSQERYQRRLVHFRVDIIGS